MVVSTGNPEREEQQEAFSFSQWNLVSLVTAMSYAAVASTANVCSAKPESLSIPYRLLLGIYGVIPICCAIVLVDIAFLNERLRISLAVDPVALSLFAIFLAIPHQVASAVTLLDREYVQAYKLKLGVGVLIIPVGLWFLSVLPSAGWKLFVVGYACYSLYHVIGQQIGITRIMAKSTDWSLLAWKWLAIAITTPMFLWVFPDRLLSVHAWPVLQVALPLLLFPLAIFTWHGARRAHTQMGSLHWWANTAMVAAVVVLFVRGYFLFAILIGRLIHDLSAFVFYVVHDYNRNKDHYHNVVYSVFRFTRLPVFVLGPLVALVVAYLLNNALTASYGAMAIIGLTLFHYYTEGFMWKRGAWHRRHVSFSP